MDLRLLSNNIRNTIIKYKLYIIPVYPLVMILPISVTSFLSISYFVTVIPLMLLYGILIIILSEHNEQRKKHEEHNN